MLSISNITVGPIATNCWLLSDTVAGQCVVVDPGDEAARILKGIEGREVTSVVLTHRHDDHRAALSAVLDSVEAEVVVHELDAHGVFKPVEGRLASRESVEAMAWASAQDRKVSRTVAEGDVVSVGEHEFVVIHTPGHTEGSICLYCAKQKVMVTGDTLFAGGGYGRTDFPGGSPKEMLETLRTRFAEVPDEVSIYPGHGPVSTMARERRLNPYLG